MLKLIISITLFLVTLSANTIVKPDSDKGPEKKKVSGINSAGPYTFLQDNSLYEQRWDVLPQTQFWRAIMRMSPDSGLINIGSTRYIVEKFASAEWDGRPTIEKDRYRDSIRALYNLPVEENIYFTAGKNHFYDFTTVLPGIHKGIEIFEQEKTDPFYAQAILLIESPGKTLRSSVGAYGSFQLMKSVAIKMGLKVDKYVDERKDFDKSAIGAARLLRTICIPSVNAMLDKRSIQYQPDELWYRLLVLHVYHAGAGNVAKVIDVIDPCEGGIDLIKTMWHTKAGSFGNASQNYSQVALASLLELEDTIYNGCEDITSCSAPEQIAP